MSNKNMFLFWGSGSAPCWKSMLVLFEKGLWDGLPNKMISFSSKEHMKEDVTKLNPRGQVPTFKDGDVVVNESGAICMYLEENYSSASNRLLPSDPAERAQVYQRMFETANVQLSITEPLVYYRWRTNKEDWDQNLLKEKTVKAIEELAIWNNYLNEKDFLVGGGFTLADVFLYPLLAFLVRMGATFGNHSNVKRYYDFISKRPSVQATWPPHWKETPGNPILGGI